MVSWLFQVPAGANPRLSQFSGIDKDHANGTTTPTPPAWTVFNWLPAKKPIDWLSGLQNGLRAPSVPRSGRGSTAVNERTQSDDPAFDFAMNATRRPSGDTAK